MLRGRKKYFQKQAYIFIFSDLNWLIVWFFQENNSTFVNKNLMVYCDEKFITSAFLP